MALLIAPFLFTRQYAERQLARYESLHQAQVSADERWRLQEHADSLSQADQRREAIEAGQFTLTGQGDTVVAVVNAPSGRPDSAAIERAVHRTNVIALIVVAVIWGSIPLALIILTVAWLLAQRRSKGLAAAA